MRTMPAWVALAASLLLWSGAGLAQSSATFNGCTYTPSWVAVGPSGGTVNIFEHGTPDACGSGHLGSIYTDTHGVNLFQEATPPYTMDVLWSFTVLPNPGVVLRQDAWGPVVIYQHCGPCRKTRFLVRQPYVAGGFLIASGVRG